MLLWHHWFVLAQKKTSHFNKLPELMVSARNSLFATRLEAACRKLLRDDPQKNKNEEVTQPQVLANADALVLNAQHGTSSKRSGE